MNHGFMAHGYLQGIHKVGSQSEINTMLCVTDATDLAPQDSSDFLVLLWMEGSGSSCQRS